MSYVILGETAKERLRKFLNQLVRKTMQHANLIPHGIGLSR